MANIPFSVLYSISTATCNPHPNKQTNKKKKKLKSKILDQIFILSSLINQLKKSMIIVVEMINLVKFKSNDDDHNHPLESMHMTDCIKIL